MCFFFSVRLLPFFFLSFYSSIVVIFFSCVLYSAISSKFYNTVSWMVDRGMCHGTFVDVYESYICIMLMIRYNFEETQ